jgi:hypothetical protein
LGDQQRLHHVFIEGLATLGRTPAFGVEAVGDGREGLMLGMQYRDTF